jgi:uncharacterized protein
MSSSTVTAAHPKLERGVPAPIERSDLPQYSLARVLGMWAAAAVPMSVLAWVVAPWLADRLGGREPLGGALLICFNAGLIWMLVLTLILVRREQGWLEWPRMLDALWPRPPQDPGSGRVGGKVWWWVVPFALLSTDRAEHFFHGAWGWFALTVLVGIWISLITHTLPSFLIIGAVLALVL